MQHRSMVRLTSAAILGALALFTLACSDSAARTMAPKSRAEVIAASDAELAAADVAGYRLYQFRSEEDPTFAGDPTVCPAAPFVTNVRLNASLYATNTRSKDGLTMNESSRKIGTATACVRITDPTFPPGKQEAFYVAFDTPAGRFTANGTCALVSNNVPEPRIVLAGCNLKIVGAPEGFVGGEATSASIFNPARIAGVNTGSYWTLLVYGDPATKS